MRAVLLSLTLLATPAFAQQTPDPFTLPPPTQRPPGQTLPGATPPAQVLTMEMLTRAGYEVKAITPASERSTSFVVLLQRAGETRTCFMRITRQGQATPKQETLCF